NRLAMRTWARQVAGQPLTTSYSYSQLTGEMLNVAYSDSTPRIAYTYKRHGGIATVTESVAGTTQLAPTFGYNTALQQETETMTGLTAKTLTRTHVTTADPSNHIPKGRPTGLTLGSEYTVAYGFDNVSRLNNVTGPGLPGGGAAGTGAVYS